MKKELLIQSIVGLFLGGGLVYLAYSFVSDELVDKIYASDNFLIIFFSIIAAIFTAIFIHEFGHLITGIVQGFQIELFVVGFLGIYRKDGKLKFYFNKDVQYFGGVAATSPKKVYDDIIKRFAFIVAGGPVFSLVVGILLWILFNQQNSIFNTFLAASGFFSILLFFATTVPSKSGSFFSDRKRFQRLLSKGNDGKVEKALFEMINRNIIDKSCKNIPQELIEIVKTDKEPFIQFWGYYYEYHKQKENNEAIDDTLLTKLKTYEKYFSKTMWKTFGVDV